MWHQRRRATILCTRLFAVRCASADEPVRIFVGEAF